MCKYIGHNFNFHYSNPKDWPDINLMNYSFPTDRSMCMAWKKAIKVNTGRDIVGPKQVICSAHFLDWEVRKLGANTSLNKLAIPSIFPPSEWELKMFKKICYTANVAHLTGAQTSKCYVKKVKKIMIPLRSSRNWIRNLKVPSKFKGLKPEFSFSRLNVAVIPHQHQPSNQKPILLFQVFSTLSLSSSTTTTSARMGRIIQTIALIAPVVLV